MDGLQRLSPPIFQSAIMAEYLQKSVVNNWWELSINLNIFGTDFNFYCL